jgi:glutamine amidotransferase
MSICIIDYGMANLRSVQKAFERVGHAARIISTPEEIAQAGKIVLPGVGAFADAVATLRGRGLADPIVRHIEKGGLFLGICLGLQMLFDVGYEDGVRFDVDRAKGLKVPHMGWNQLVVKNPSPLTAGLAEGANVYFVHSYHAVPDDPKVIATVTDYGGEFVSSVRADNVMATQFHPEKSQKVGLEMLRNFAEL